MREVSRRNKINKKPIISDEEIIELREEGWSYSLMAKHFEETGRKITASALHQRCTRIYDIIGQKIPRTTKTKCTRDESKVKDRKIFELKEKGYSYAQIKDYYEKRGIEISVNRLVKRCQAIYEKKELGKPKKGISKIARKYDEEEIFKLRQRKWSYEKIASYIGSKEGSLSYITIRKLCKRIYKEKGLEEPKLFRGLKTGEQTGVSDEEITQLKMQGYTYGQMVKHFKNIGKSVSRNNIAYRSRVMFGSLENGKRTAIDIRTVDESLMEKALINLKQTKGATDKQLEILANTYGKEYISQKEKLNPYKISKYDIER